MSDTSLRLLWALRIAALTLVALHLAAPLLPEAVAWGVWPANYLSPGWRWGLGLVVSLLILMGHRLPVSVRGNNSSRWRILATHSRAVRIGAAVLAAIPFYLFRLQHLRWGDAYLLANAIAHPDAKLTFTWQAPLDVFIHAKAWALGNRLFGWPDATPAYWLLSTAAGIAFVWLVLEVAHESSPDPVARLLLGGLILTLGTIQLFFGYVENYSIMTMGVLAYLWLALRALRGESALAWPAAALAITHAFHPSSLILVPSLLYLVWRTRERKRRFHHLAGIVVPYTLVFLGVLALMTAGNHGIGALLSTDAPGGGDRRWFVPLFQITSQWEHYTMFSWGHLIDIVNQQLLSAPVVWSAIGLSIAFARHRLPREDAALRFLLLAATCYLTLTLAWNPDYGGQRDWDLFTPAAVPATLLLARLLPRVLPERRALVAAGCTLIATQAFHTIAWIYQNTQPWSWA